MRQAEVMFTYVLVPAPLSTIKEVTVAVCQAVAQRFPQRHFPAPKIWDVHLVAVVIELTCWAFPSVAKEIMGVPGL